jgi:uncharacterized membrane protein YczE
LPRVQYSDWVGVVQKSAPSPAVILTRRWVQLLVGLTLYGIAIALMVRAGIGLSPWDVLSQGLTRVTGIPFGVIVVLTGVVVLLLWIPLRERPGIGTVLNILLIGPAAELGLWLVPQQTVWWAQGLVFTGGLVLLAVASGLYVGARFGPGPRDGLMTGIHSRFGWPIWAARTAIEVTVLTIGWLLGGQVGLGTLAFAALIGPLVNITLPLLRVPEPATAPEPESPEPTPHLSR